MTRLFVALLAATAIATGQQPAQAPALARRTQRALEHIFRPLED